jgi:hypothetical protein
MATATKPGDVEVLAQQNAAEIGGQIAVLDQTFSTVKIDNPQDYQVCGDAMIDIKKRSKSIEEKRKEIVTPLNEALKRVNALFKPPIERLDAIAARISAAMSWYQRRAEEEARQERERLAVEAAKEQERLRKEAEKQAVRAEKSGDEQSAAMIRSAAETMTVPAPVVQTSIPKVQGIGYRETWTGEVFDLFALIMAVACGDVPIRVLAPVQSVLNDAAKTAGNQLNWPGVRVIYKKEAYSTGRG